jgi:LacI family transcriptional regulator
MTTRRIALYFPMRPGSAQDFLRGIARFARPDRPWEFCLTFGWDAGPILDWSPDGFIGHAFSEEAARLIESLPCPRVETAFDYEDLDLPRVGLDDRAIGGLAADHLLDLGFRDFVYFGEEGRAYSRRRWEGFEARLRAAGHRAILAPPVLAPGSEVIPPPRTEARDLVAALPRPAALFAVTDILALQLLEIARSAEIRVPEELAVLGVGNIDLMCALAYPPLSSIRTAAEAAGYEAARLLDRLMEGEARPGARIEFPPLGVETRRSTDLYAVTDTDLSAALRFIREHAHQGIGVPEVMKAVSLSRSTLERRFRTALGRSPLEEILRVRTERARQLLLETDWPMGEVARNAGLRDGQHLSELFRSRTGMTPKDYRSRFRSV